MYVNGKMIPVEIFQEMEEERINVSSMIHLIYSKTFCKCHNIPPLQQTNKKSAF
jgi:hypothetical protein